MELTFLGTGAGESYPGLWCRCSNCSYARKAKGKNIRANSCAVLDKVLLLDMGPMCFHQAASFGIDLSQIHTLLVTHCHKDHLYPTHLHWREVQESHLDLPEEDQMHEGGPRFTPLPELSIYGNAFAEAVIQPYLEEKPSPHAHFTRIQEGVTFETVGYSVTPVRGNHHAAGFAHGYIIEKDGKTLLYALDTGLYDPDMLELVTSHTYDLVVNEGTTGLNTQYGGHMCLRTNRQFKSQLEEHHCLKPGARFILTHMSPHWCPPHDQYAPVVEQYGMELAYDGLTVFF